jgi:catechol 2,3-dioxygenase-like lactoylglutathione lyase family enzyme
MSLLHSGGTNNIGVRHLSAATEWYIEKLGLRRIRPEENDPESVSLGFSEEEYAMTLGPPGFGGSSDELTHMLFTSNIQKAWKFLSSRGVRVGEIQQDRQGTHYFEMHDLDGNVIEITEEP